MFVPRVSPLVRTGKCSIRPSILPTKKRKYCSLRSFALQPYKDSNEGDIGDDESTSCVLSIVGPGIAVIKCTSRCLDSCSNDTDEIVFPSVDQEDFQENFRTCISFCKNRFSFSHDSENCCEIENKTRILIKLSAFLSKPENYALFPEDLYNITAEMVYENLFSRSFVDKEYDSLPDQSFSIYNPEWKHLQHIYSIYHKLVDYNPRSFLISVETIKKLFSLLKFPDSMERQEVIVIIRNFLDKNPDMYNTIVNCTQKGLTDFLDGISPPYTVVSLFTLLLNLFNKDNQSFSQGFQNILVSFISPLLISQHLTVYYQSIYLLFTFLLEPECLMAYQLFNILMKYWPKTSALKQPCFINLAILAMRTMPLQHFAGSIKRFMKLMQYILQSPHEKSVESAIDYFLKCISEPRIKQSYALIIKTSFKLLHSIAETHWSESLRKKAKQTIIELTNCDKESVDKEIEDIKLSSLSKKLLSSQNHRQLKNWLYVAQIAFDNNNFDEQTVFISIKEQFPIKIQISRNRSVPSPPRGLIKAKNSEVSTSCPYL